MRDRDDHCEALPESLQFPLTWHGRVIVQDRGGTAERIDAILKAHGFDETATRGRSSQNGKYVTFRLALTVPSRETFDAVTASLEQLDGVKMVL